MDFNLILRFLFGTVIGSFLNVAALRYSESGSLWKFKKLLGRSICPACGKTLRWFELIPVLSFLVLRGRCRSCRARISLQYPAVEITSGFTLAFIPGAVSRAFGLNFLDESFAGFLLTAVFAAAALIFILIAAIDSRLRIIPDEANLVIGFLGLGAALIQSAVGLFGAVNGSFLGSYALMLGIRNSVWLNHLSAALFGLIFFGAIIILTRGRGMGMGDLKLAAAAGFLIGWPDILIALMLAFILGSLFSIIPIMRRTKNLKSHLAFGPFIVFGIFLVMFFGKEIMAGYFSIF